MGLKRLIVQFYTKEKLILFLLVSLFLTLEIINIKLPGLYADEALPACGSLQIIKKIDPIIWSVKIFNTYFPLTLGVTHEAALESYILLPFFYLFGINVVVLRLVPVVIGAVTLIFMYFFLKGFFSRGVGLLSLFLLVINSIFLLETKLGLNSASMLHFTGMAALWSLFRWYKSKGNAYFYLGVFLLCVGISIRIWFLWFFNGVIILSIIFRHRLRERLKGNIWKYVAIFCIIFLLSNSPFVYYNLTSRFGTFRHIIKNFSKTTEQDAVNNLSYSKNLQERFRVFTRYLNGSWSLLEQGCWNNRTSWKEISLNRLYPFMFWAVFIYLVFCAIFNKTKFSRKRIWFVLILFSLILLQSPFTLSSLGGPHLFILYPLVQIILGLGLIEVVRKFKKNIIMLTIITCATVIFVFLECNNTVRNNFLYFKKTGGTGNNSDSIYALSNYFQDAKIFKPIIMDWGIYHNLIFLSKAQTKPRTFVYVQGGFQKEEFISELNYILHDENARYVFHAPEYTNRQEIYPIFEKAYKAQGKNINREVVFNQRDGRPVYVIYSVR